MNNLNSDSLRSLLSSMLAVVFLKLSLDISYWYYVSPAFSDHWLAPMVIEFSPVRYFLSFFWVILIIAFATGSLGVLERLAVFIPVAFIHIPISVMYGFDVQMGSLPILCSTLAIVSSVSAMRLRISTRLVRIYSVDPRYLLLVCFLFVGYFIARAYFTGAISSFNLVLSEIYYYRELTGSILDAGVFGYFNLWTQKVFNIFLLVYGLYARKYVLVVFCLAIQVYFFGVTNHRVHLFTPFLIFLIIVISRKDIHINKLYIGVAIGCLVVLGLTQITGDETIASLMLRRAFFVPASVSIQWVEFFVDREKVFFADNLLEFAFPNSQYSGLSLPLFMGDYIRDGYGIAFNSGIVGAGYAQLGIVGVLFYGFVLGLVVNLASVFIRIGVPLVFCGALLISPIRTAWGDSDLFTALLSHGILVSICLLMFCGSLKHQRD